MAKDFLLINGDLAIENGDFVIAESDGQHIEDIFQAAPGDWRESPLLGLSIDLYKNAPDPDLIALQAAAMNQLKLDGYNVQRLEIRRVNEVMQITCKAFRNE